jgi:PAS domain S-box-containing protein
VQPVQPLDNSARALIDTVLVGEALEHGPVAVFVFDEEGRSLAVNGMACELLGYERDGLLGRRFDALAEHMQAAIETGGETTAAVEQADGTTVLLRLRASAARAAGMPVFVGVAWPAA